jgi:hypothetical protein
MLKNEKSIFMKACRSFSASKFVNQSAILSFIKKLGMRKLLIAAFALYLPLDWVIRDVLKISALASIWDEAFLVFCIAFGVILAISRTAKKKMDIAEEMTRNDMESVEDNIEKAAKSAK